MDVDVIDLFLKQKMEQLKAKVAAEEALAAVVQQQQEQHEAAAIASGGGSGSSFHGGESGSGRSGEGTGSRGGSTPVSHAARTVTAAGAELRRLEEELERRLDRILALEEEVCCGCSRVCAVGFFWGGGWGSRGCSLRLVG